MATFSESQITDLAVILGTNSDYLSRHLEMYAEAITDSDKTKVLELASTYDGFDTGDVYFTPTESNEGLNSNTIQQKGSVASKIAALLQWDFAYSATSGGLIRG